MLKGLCHMRKSSLLRALMMVAGLVTAGAFTTPANALVEININKGNVQPLPIAVTDFLQGESSGHIDLTKARAGGFAGGLFALYSPSPRPATTADPANAALSRPLPPPLPMEDARASVVGELAMLVKYAHTAALQREAIWAVSNSFKIYTMHAHEVRRLAAEAAGTVYKPQPAMVS